MKQEKVFIYSFKFSLRLASKKPRLSLKTAIAASGSAAELDPKTVQKADAETGDTSGEPTTKAEGITTAAVVSIDDAPDPSSAAPTNSGAGDGAAKLMSVFDDPVSLEPDVSSTPTDAPGDANKLMSAFIDPAEEAVATPDTAAAASRDSVRNGGAAKLMSMFNEPTSPKPEGPALTSTVAQLPVALLPEAVVVKSETSNAGQNEIPSGRKRSASVESSAAKNTEKDETHEQENKPHVTVVNIKEYVLKELKALHQGDWITQSPTITSDESGETFQVCLLNIMCILPN